MGIDQNQDDATKYIPNECHAKGAGGRISQYRTVNREEGAADSQKGKARGGARQMRDRLTPQEADPPALAPDPIDKG